MFRQLLNSTSIFAFTTFLLASAEPAFGQTVSEKQVNVPEGSTNGVDKEIVVTAQKRVEPLREVPATLLVRDSDDLERAGVRDPSDLAIAVPGLTYGVSNGFAQPAMRGISTISTSPNVEVPVGIYIDGILQPSQSANSAFDLRLVSEAEFLKGPQGTVFGRNVVAGAILFTTRGPNLQEVVGEVAADVSTFGGGTSKSAFAYSALGFVSIPIVSDTLAVSLGVSRKYNQGFIKDLTPGTDGRTGGMHSENVQAKILWEPSSNFSALLNYRYMNSNVDQGPSISDNVATVLRFSDGLIASEPWQSTHNATAFFAKTRTHSLSLKADLELDVGTITSLTAWQQFNNTAQTNSNGGYSPMCVAAGSCNALLLIPDLPEVISQEVNFSSRKFGSVSLVTGIYALSKKVHSERFSGGVLGVDLTSLTRSFAGFAEVTLDITDSLSAIAGGRYNFDSESTAGTNASNRPYGPEENRNWAEFTKRFSLKYRLNDHVNLYGTYSEGYQPGLVASQSFNTASGALVPPAKPIDPQQLYAWEVGAKFNFPGINFNVSAFDYRYKNIIGQSFNGTVITLQNAASASLRGVDADFGLRLAQGLQLQGGVSWLPRANFTDFPNATVTVKSGTSSAVNVLRDLTGTRLIRSPEVTASGTLTYDFAALDGEWSLSASGYYSSGYGLWAGFGNIQPAYATLGFHASFRPNAGPLELSVFGRNLTNNSYLANVVRSPASFQNWYSPPRELGVGATYKF